VFFSSVGTGVPPIGSSTTVSKLEEDNIELTTLPGLAELTRLLVELM
jgi:hypothetical protein